ncbi:prepilin-type N-terminal cleavage/methylation domain-containing protein [Ureibacillus sp. NPDC094379]
MDRLNEKGVTLIEVIASIVILTVVLISFLNFFPQMGKTNNYNGDKQQAINLAGTELSFWQNELNNNTEFIKTQSNLGVSGVAINVDKTDNPHKIKMVTDQTYSSPSHLSSFDVEVIVTTEPDLNTDPMKAYQIQINIFKEGSVKNNSLTNNAVKVTETYGYIFIKDE